MTSSSRFTTSLAAVQARIEASRSAAGSGSGSNKGLTYLYWKPGEKKIIRFISDTMIDGEFYDFIITKDGKTTNFLVDPDDPDRLRRYMAPSPGLGWRKTPSGPIEEPVAKRMVVGMAVVRKEEPGPDRRLVVQDERFDRTVGDATLPSRIFGIVQQASGNFWNTLTNGYFPRHGTISNCDFEVRREGSTRDTKYTIIPLPQDPALTDPAAVSALYGYGEPWNNEDPNRFLKCPMTLDEWAEYFAGEERYRYWLTPGDSSTPTPSGMDEFAPATTHNMDEAQQVVAPNTRFTSIQDTLLAKHGGQPGA